MTIFLPIKLSATGGTSSFARKFQVGMAARGHHVTFVYQPNYDILLASPTAPLRYLLQAKLTGRPIVHRLDGVYYPNSSAGHFWRALNVQLSIIRSFFADYIIYQSEFSKRACDYYLSRANYTLPTTRHNVIYNGVDTLLFSPQGNTVTLKDNPDQHLILSASRFRRVDQVLPILQSFAYYHQIIEPNSKLVLIGNLTPALEKLTRGATSKELQKHIAFLGTIPNNKLPAYLRSADVFVLTHRNPPCPNNVLEAMACGLPVCGIADGSMPELIAHGVTGELLSIDAGTLWSARPIKPAALATMMHSVVQRRAPYAAASRQRVLSRFTLEQMINAYLDVFNAIRNESATRESLN